MTEEMIYINDPLGRIISFSKKLCSLEIEHIDSHDPYDDLSSVIAKPAILIETSDLPVKLFYFRSIGWQLSVLIKVKFEKRLWEAYKCIINPSDADIVGLLKKGKQII